MSYQVRLPVFEGPLDLLLHLIEKNEVDIYDIPIALITEQYLEYLALSEKIDLELTSEFLLMACTLLSIKARMLLPASVCTDDEDMVDDPRSELVQKILEYKLYKEMAEEFKERETAQNKVFWRQVDEAALLKQFPPANPLGTVSTQDLIKVYSHILRKIEKKKEVYSITREEITIQEKIEYILAVLTEKSAGMSFYRLFSGLTTRGEVIVTFLALLELSRRGILLLRQSHLFGDILIFLKNPKEEEDCAHSVS